MADASGWFGYSPKVVESAELGSHDLSISLGLDGGFDLTITDNVAERGQASHHSTVEEAERHALRVTGVSAIAWRIASDT